MPPAPTGPTGGDAGAGSVQSVDRALTILDLLGSEAELGVTEIAGMLSVHKSTASRLLATLESHGLVEQYPDRGRYRLGVGLLRLAGATRARLDVVKESREITESLAGRVGETVNVVILSGNETLYLDQVTGSSSIQIHNWVGHRNPLHATANGRVLLANVSPERRGVLLAAISDADGRLPLLTEHSIATVPALLDELEQVQARGYALAVDELELGLTAVAAPIRGLDGDVIASVSISGPSFRLGTAELPRVVEAVREAAESISARMGDRARLGRR
jgi:DNA-binding IclR family transcriptional regulator